MDTRNTLLQHILVAIFSIILLSLFVFVLDIKESTAFARTSFILLFITMGIGPLMKLKKPKDVSSPLKTPWTWRSEFGLWFTITGLLHVVFVLNGRPNWNILKSLGGGIGGGGYGLANLLGYIALIWAVILAITSFGKVIKFLGVKSWKWLHSFAYVLFYLVATHLIYFQFFSNYGGGPDWFGWTAVVMTIIIIGAQSMAFIKTIINKRNTARPLKK